MRQEPDRWRPILVGAALLIPLASCGVPLQSSADPIPSGVLGDRPPSTSATGSTISPTAPSALSRLPLWFVSGDGLTAELSSLPRRSSAEQILAALAEGPSAASEADLRTVARDPLTGQALIRLPTSAESPGQAVDGTVTVQVSAAFSALPPAEQVLLLGQVVLSLSGAGAESVVIVDESGTPMAVPLPDGRLLDAPATASDYASLMTRP